MNNPKTDDNDERGDRMARAAFEQVLRAGGADTIELDFARQLSDILTAAGAVNVDLNAPDVAANADATEMQRRTMIETNQPAADLADNKEDQTWDSDALQREFTVDGFMAPFVVVRRKSDGAKGTLEFTHLPRVYFGWQADVA